MLFAHVCYQFHSNTPFNLFISAYWWTNSYSELFQSSRVGNQASNQCGITKSRTTIAKRLQRTKVWVTECPIILGLYVFERFGGHIMQNGIVGSRWTEGLSAKATKTPTSTPVLSFTTAAATAAFAIQTATATAADVAPSESPPSLSPPSAASRGQRRRQQQRRRWPH